MIENPPSDDRRVDPPPSGDPRLEPPAGNEPASDGRAGDAAATGTPVGQAPLGDTPPAARSDVRSTRRGPSGASPRLTLIQLGALVGYTVRESLHRWTMLTFLVGVTFFLILLATAVNLDIVEGTLASARLFGQDLALEGEGIRIRDVVNVFQVVVISVLYVVGVALALFATSNLVPRLLSEGWVDLLIAQPIGRSRLVLGRALGGLTVVTVNVGYLIVGSWLLLRWKTGFGNSGFLIAGLLILYAFGVCYSYMVLVGVVTRNSPVSAMSGLFVWIGGLVIYPFHAFEGWRAALRSGWPRQTAVAITESVYWILPKSQGLGEAAVAAARGEAYSLTPVWASLPFAVASLGFACWWFSRRDY